MNLDFKTIVTLDFETFYSNDYTLSKLTTEGYIRDERFETIGVGVKVNAGAPVWLDHAAFKRWVAQVDWPNVAVLAHHAHFDGLTLSHHYGVKPGFWLDTLSMGRLMHTIDVGGSLSKLAAYYHVGEKGHEVILAKGKQLADFTREEWEQYGRYCMNDCELTWRIFHAMLERGIPEDELKLIDLTVRMFTEPTLKLNLPMLETYLTEERARKQALLDRIAKDKEVLMSNDKFALLLMELGIEPPTKISKRTGEETWAFAKTDPGMQELLEHDNEQVRWAAEARVGTKSTINETRTERFIKSGAKGSVPVYLKYHGAHTGRWSGGDKMNMQNLQRGGVLRDAIEAPEGKLLVVADSAQIEARTLAWFAGHQSLVDAFAQGRDVYSEFASSVYGRKITKADETERFVGKTAVLGLGYGMGWNKFALTMASKNVLFTWTDVQAMRVDVEEFGNLEDKYGKTNREKVEEMPSRLELNARMIHCAVAWAIVNKYRELNRPIVEVWDGFQQGLDLMLREDCDEECGPITLERHQIRLASGRVLRYPGLNVKQDMFGDNVYSYVGGRVGKEKVHAYGGLITENVIQALARDIIADQVLRMPYHVATTTHDEVLLVVDEAEAPAAFERVMREMSIPPSWASGLPVKAEGGFGKSYGEVK